MMFQPSTRKDSSGDYHKVFNGGNFLKWFEEQLLPNLGDCPSVIMMDNAAYHLVYSEHVPRPSKMKKAELIAYLQSKGQPIVNEEGRPLTALLLRAKAKEYIKEFEVSAVIELAKKGNHKILFTPPYHSDLQPIELVWALVKGNIARLYSNGRTMDQLEKQLKDEFKDLLEEEGAERIGAMIENTARLTKKFWDDIPREDEDEEDPQDSDDESSASESDSSDEEEAETDFFDGFEGAAAEV
jgi:transposase